MSLKRSHTSSKSAFGGSDAGAKVDRQELYDELKRMAVSNESFSPVDISLSIGAGEPQVSKALLGLAAEGYLEKVETGKYKAAGMQQAVTVMRQAGYKGPIVIPGISYANNLTQWLSHKPKDPLNQLVAEAHVYGKNTCSSNSCLTREMGPVAAKVPLIFGETGPSYDDSECGSATISKLLGWADAHGVGYETWTWNTWNTCNSLIRDFKGTPRTADGK